LNLWNLKEKKKETEKEDGVYQERIII